MQPTRTTTPTALPERPHSDPARPKFMAALALAEHLISMAEVPTELRIDLPPRGTEAVVEAYAHNNIALLHAWQRRFGGELHHELRDNGRKVFSSLTGRVYDAPFKVWTLRDLTAVEPTAAELEVCACWIDRHGDPAEWSAETRAAYAEMVATSKAKEAS